MMELVLYRNIGNAIELNEDRSVLVHDNKRDFFTSHGLGNCDLQYFNINYF